MKTLVVDDSGVMRKIIIRGLNACGIQDITEAADGQKGWAAFQADQFDIVLTDWNMPEMTGLELLKAIRGSGATVPVIMITTEAERAKVVEAIHAGVTDYLSKPFEQAELQAKLDKYVVAS
ncbi:MAG: response regulator [Aureliella sp.]